MRQVMLMPLAFSASQHLALHVQQNADRLPAYLHEDDRLVAALLDSRQLTPLEPGRYRYVVTSLRGCSAEWLYDHRYCARGEMENRIKEQQFLFSDRTSCHAWWPNQYRLLLSGLAYLLLERLRRIYLKRTAFAQAQVNTIRLKLLKIGAVITRNTRTIRLMLNSQCSEQDLFLKLVSKLVPG